jgi:hypothetical protein
LESAQELIVRKTLGIEDLSTSAEERAIRFYTTEREFNLSESLSMLMDAELKVTQCREVPMDLEEAFLTIAEEHHAPAVSGAG